MADKQSRLGLLLKLPRLSSQIWLAALGRLLLQAGTGFTLFYAAIFFVNHMGFSATAVGFATSLGSVAGVVGRFWGGALTDTWGRRRTLMLSAGVSAIADFLLALTTNLPVLIIANLLMGLGVGLYWPATETLVADLTTGAERNEAFAVTRLADSVGLGLGVILGGLLISATGHYQTLFIIDGISFVVFMVLIQGVIRETLHQIPTEAVGRGWLVAGRDRLFLVFLVVNIFFTSYLAYVNTTLPLYWHNFVPGFSQDRISLLFSVSVVLSALFQLPVARSLENFSRPQALLVSMLLWGIGFCLVWGVAAAHSLALALAALAVFSMATVAYTPSASAFVVQLAPQQWRGIYLSLNSQCWAVGYFLAPAIGGWMLDRPKAVADSFWLFNAASVVVGLGILAYLQRQVGDRHN